jgi:hypothetical protein
MRPECHEQALETRTTSTLDVLRDPLRIQCRTSWGKPIFYH